MKDFNINDYVKVKLTDVGLQILETQHNEMLKRMTPETAKTVGPFKAPAIDEEGYSQIQLGELMHFFGNYMYSGNSNIPLQISDQYLVEHVVKNSRSK